MSAGRQVASRAESGGYNRAGKPDSRLCRLLSSAAAHTTDAYPSRHRERRWTQEDRWVGSALPGEIVGRSIFRVRICVPQPPRNIHPNPQLRRPGILAGAETALKGTLCLVPSGSGPARTIEAYQAQLLLTAGNPDTQAPMWRRIG